MKIIVYSQKIKMNKADEILLNNNIDPVKFM